MQCVCGVNTHCQHVHVELHNRQVWRHRLTVHPMSPYDGCIHKPQALLGEIQSMLSCKTAVIKCLPVTEQGKNSAGVK